MSVDEFKRLLALGLGRAVFHLEHHEPTPYREAILHACLYPLAYDRICEESREIYCFDLITRSGERAWFRDQLLAVLPIPPDDCDSSQILGIVRLLAAEGDEQARAALYAAFAARAASSFPDGADEIIRLDGVLGLLHVAGMLVLDEEDIWYARYLIDLAIELNDADTVETALAEATTNVQVAAFVDMARRKRAKSAARTEARARDVINSADYDQIRRDLLAGSQPAERRLYRWVRVADEARLLQAARDLVSENDEERLWVYLGLFRDRPFPLDPILLLPYTYHSNPRIAATAITALEHFTNPVIRARAEELLAAGSGRGASLLASNFQTSDFALLDHLLRTWTDREALHDLGFGVRDVVAAQPIQAAVPALLAMYEYSPCALCRYHAVEWLQQLNAAPAWLLDECRYDSSSEIREAVTSDR